MSSLGSFLLFYYKAMLILKKENLTITMDSGERVTVWENEVIMMQYKVNFNVMLNGKLKQIIRNIFVNTWETIGIEEKDIGKIVNFEDIFSIVDVFESIGYSVYPKDATETELLSINASELQLDSMKLMASLMTYLTEVNKKPEWEEYDNVGFEPLCIYWPTQSGKTTLFNLLVKANVRCMDEYKVGSKISPFIQVIFSEKPIKWMNNFRLYN